MSMLSSDCGFRCWHPKWLNRFATARWFTLVYGFLGTLHTASVIYFAVTLSTIQKRFKIPSQTTGVILSGNEISQILLSLILAYYGGRRDRPRWIAWGIFFNALSCFVLASPHFMYGAGDTALELSKEYEVMFQKNASEALDIISTVPLKENSKLCQIAEGSDDGCFEIFSYVPLIMIFLSQFVLGIGNTLYMALGQSYLDDSSSRKRSPMVFAYAFAMRMIGPIIGFNISNIALKTYINPLLTPTIEADDPRWLGAWWLGWSFFGVVMLVLAGLVAMFPENMKDQNSAEDSECRKVTNKKLVKEEPSLEDFSRSLKRLLRNKLIMFNIFSTVFYTIGHNVFSTFLSRVMEVQFNQPATTTSITGSLTIGGIMCGFLLSGVVITKFKPPPNYLFFWNILIGVLLTCGQYSFSFFGCDSNNINLINGTLQSCNENCYCDDMSYTPICHDQLNETFFSPCHAGCKVFDPIQNLYTNCSCSSDDNYSTPLETILTKDFDRLIDASSKKKLNQVSDILSTNMPEIIPRIQQLIPGTTNKSPTYKPGACPNDCTHDLIMFSLISLTVSFISSTGKVGNILVDLRSIEPRDKSLAQGLSLCLISLLASIPAPIIYGRIIDITCISWSYKCGGLGNCQLYDPKLFRTYLHQTAAFFIAIGTFFDFLVWCFGKNVDLYGTDDQEDNKETHELTECEPLKK